MDDQAVKKISKRRPFTLLAGVYLIILYLCLCLIIIFVGRQQVASINLPTPTVAISPVPHILVQQSSSQTNVLHEDFSSNKLDWGLYYDFGKLEIIDGKLILQSNIGGGTVGISDKFAPTSLKYYLQADFSTDIETTSAYGLVFGMNQSLDTYYLFDLLPRSSGVQLFKYNAGKWTPLTNYLPIKTNSFPQSNVLSVYFDNGNMQLYVNGDLASKYLDQDYFQSKDVGVYADNMGYRLIVDDFFVNDIK